MKSFIQSSIHGHSLKSPKTILIVCGLVVPGLTAAVVGTDVYKASRPENQARQYQSQDFPPNAYGPMPCFPNGYGQ